MKGYTSISKIENYLLITIATDFYDQVNEWIEEIEAHIDRVTGRNFVADAEATKRVFDGDNSNVLLIDDAVEITKVEVDGEDVTEDCFLYPANSLPVRKISLFSGVFSRGMQNVSVTAKWGYSVACPKDIGFVARVLTVGIINNSEEEGVVQSERIGNYQVSYSSAGLDDFAKDNEILKKYKKIVL